MNTIIKNKIYGKELKMKKTIKILVAMVMIFVVLFPLCSLVKGETSVTQGALAYYDRYRPDWQMNIYGLVSARILNQSKNLNIPSEGLLIIDCSMNGNHSGTWTTGMDLTSGDLYWNGYMNGVSYGASCAYCCVTWQVQYLWTHGDAEVHPSSVPVTINSSNRIRHNEYITWEIIMDPSSGNSKRLLRLSNSSGLVAEGYGENPDWVFDIYARSVSTVYRAPVVTQSDDLTYMIGEKVDHFAGLRARWGITSGNLILPSGEIKDVSPNSPIFNTMVNTDNFAVGIGVAQRVYEFRDNHSLNTTNPIYSGDSTFATGRRNIIIKTTLSPTLMLTYGSTADPAVVGLPYDANTLSRLPCGGEDGWTNQPIRIDVDPNTILGDFDTVIKNPSSAVATTANGIATYDNYHAQTLSDETTVEGVLTERNKATNELSGVAQGKVKIDTTAPIPGATHQGGISFTDTSSDALSGKSVANESLIALVPAGTVTTPNKTDATTFSLIAPKTTGFYDVYVWAFDKAGNEAVELVSTVEIEGVGGEVIIKKDTDKGATLHSVDCDNHDSIEKEGDCDSSCIVGEEQGIVENTNFTYELTIENTDTTKSATGIFTDYLPKGFSKTMTSPTITGTGITSPSATFIEDGGPNDGQWEIKGTYTLAAEESTKVSIAVTAPKYADIEDASKIISNQAGLTWTLDPGGTETTGTATSNYANHEITASPSVETKFTKVGAGDTTQGLIGAKFALYKWTGDATDYIGHEDNILDANELDGGEASGLWVRVKKDAEDGNTSDFFDTDALGQVVLGELPTGIYTLIETKAPSGYELPVGQWTLVIDAGNTDSGEDDWKIEYKAKSDSILPPAVIRVPDSGGNPPSYRIVNTKPFSVGMTGMNGTGGIIFLGLALMLIAGIGYSIYQYKGKKKSKDNKNKAN